MDLIKELGPSGSDNDDEEQEEGLIIIPPQCHTPDSSSAGKIIVPRAAFTDPKDPAKGNLFRQSVKNKLKAYTEGRVSLPGSPIPSKSDLNKKERKLTKEEDSPSENGTLVDRDKKQHDNSSAVTGDLSIASIVITQNVDIVGQNDTPCKSNINYDRVQDVDEVDFSKKIVPRTIERSEIKIRKLKSYPKSWLEIKEKQIELNALRDYVCNPVNTDPKATSDFRQQLLFKSPANLLNGLTCKGAESKPNQRVAPQYLRYTFTNPQVAWSVNPNINSTLSRSEIFDYISPCQKAAIEKLIEMKSITKSIDKKSFTKWYTKIPLLLCETDNSGFEPLRLSFMNNISDNEDRDDEPSYELTPKRPDNRSSFVEENILVKSEKKRKKKRSRSTTEDEDFSIKKRNKRHNKEKKKKSKHSKLSEKPIFKKGKYIDILPEDYLDIEPEKHKSKKRKYVDNLPEDFLEEKVDLRVKLERRKSDKEKYVNIMPEIYLEEPVEDSKSKKNFKSFEHSEYKEKSYKRSKDHSKSTEHKEEYSKSRKHFTKSRSKSHEDIPGKDCSKTKANEGDHQNQSHTPRTEEYHSRWESDEELLKLERHAKKKNKRRSSSKNMSWESDDEHASRQKYSTHHHRSAAERSLEIPLEMPLNITHVLRHPTSPKYDEGKHRKEEPTFYSEDSWERGEYLKIKNELDNIELQKGRQTLSEERRQLEIEKRRLVEMEHRLAEQRHKQQQQKDTIVMKKEPHAESKEKRYFENIGKEDTQEANFVCEYHKAIIDSKRKSRWDTPKDDSDSISVHNAENYSTPPRPVSTSPFPFHKSPAAIDVDNYSPKIKQASSEATPVPIEVEEELTTKDLLEEVQVPTSTSSGPVLNQNSEKVVELENEYEQFMMSLVNAKDAQEAKICATKVAGVKLEEVGMKVGKAKSKKSTSSGSSDSTSDSSSGSSDSSESSSSHSLAEIKVKSKKKLSVINQDELLSEKIIIGSEKAIITDKPVSTSSNISIDRERTANRPRAVRPRVPTQILETIIIDDDDVPPPVKSTKILEIDLSKIELPPQCTASMEVPLNLIELPPATTIKTELIPEIISTLLSIIPNTIPPEVEVEEPPPVLIPQAIVSLPPPPLPPADEAPPSLPNIPEEPISGRPETPKIEDTSIKRNNLISIKFLSPKKRALEMSNSMAAEASDGEEEKKEGEDSTANTKKLFSFNDPPSPRKEIKPVETSRPLDTRPLLITAEEKAKLDQMRKETLERNEKWILDRSVPPIKESREPILMETTSESIGQHKDKYRDEPASTSNRQRKDSSSCDRKKSSQDQSSNKRRPSKERDSGQRRRSVSPISKRRRISPSRSERDRDRDRDRDKDRLRRQSPKRVDKERDRREGKPRRSRSRSPVKSKTNERRRSRDNSPRRRSGDRDRDRRDNRRASPPRSRRRSPSPSIKRRSNHRERSRSTDRKKERIEDTLKRLAGLDVTPQYNTTSTSTHHSTNPSSNRSPRSSPLDGFKRSLADSTISDDQLLPAITESPIKQSPKTEYYKSTTSYHSSYHSKHDNNVKPKLSPKRPSLDDRINQVLGIEKTEVEEIPRRISTTYEGQYDYGNKYSYQQQHHTDYNRSGYGIGGGEMKAEDGSRLVQMGNVLQIVPAASSGGEISRSRKDHSSSHHHHHHHSISSTLHHQSHSHLSTPPQQQILQVGNMLQIVPTVLPAAPPPSKAASAAIASVAPPPPPPLPPPPLETTVFEEKVLSSAEELLRQQHAQRKAEKEVRRQERDKRRKEKERKQKEREKKKALRVKTKTEDIIKRALMLETEENVEEDVLETAAVVEEVDEEVKWSPSNPILAAALANLTKPVGKSILTSEKLSKLNVTKALELLTESRKQVKFADGIIPGEGTSPSAGEELTSPPPSGKRALKEKRHTKSLLSKAVRNKLSKKKVKVKVVRSNSKKHSSSSSRNPTNPASNPPNPNPVTPPSSTTVPTEADLELLPPPSPPPGSPPPHIFPARVKPPPPPNNIHPTTAAAYLPATAAHYPYVGATVAGGMIYQGQVGVGLPVGVGYVAAPPPPPPPPPPVTSTARYGASIPALPPTHQLPHHLAVRAGVSHKSRQ